MARTQLGLRLSNAEAEELRAAAADRRMTLGELVTTLLRESRADAGRGLWVDLDPSARRALDAVAGAAGESPEQALRRMIDAWLAGQLEDLIAGLRRSAVATERADRRAEPARADRDDDDDDVGTFTVSED